MTATEAKRGFRTHFDIINERIQKLEITLKDNKAEFYDLFETPMPRPTSIELSLRRAIRSARLVSSGQKLPKHSIIKLWKTSRYSKNRLASSSLRCTRSTVKRLQTFIIAKTVFCSNKKH